MSENFTAFQPNYDTWEDSYEQRKENDSVEPAATFNPNQESSLTGSELEPETIEAKGRREDGLYLSPTYRFLAEDVPTEPADEVEKTGYTEQPVTDGGTNIPKEELREYKTLVSK